MKWSLIFITFVTLLAACKEKKQTSQVDALVGMQERVLTRTEVNKQIPKGLSSEDSLLLAESIVKKWVKDELVYQVVLRNLSDEKETIDQLVEDYRRSLIRYRYQEHLLKERLLDDISESDMMHYYEAHQDKFVLEESLIKGLFLKVPADAPSLNEVKSWCRSASESSLEKIEKYCIQNAHIYEYFYDKWIDFDEVMVNVPLHVADQGAFLKANRFVEVSDSSYCYLLNIKEYLPIGAVAPFDYAMPQVKEMLLNQRKVVFLKEFEDELYNDAVRDGDVTFYPEPGSK